MKLLLGSIALLYGLAVSVVAQDAKTSDTVDVTARLNEKIGTLNDRINSLEEAYLETRSTVDKLKKIKLSGYIQTQFRMALNYDEATDTSISHKTPGTYAYPVGDFAGGTFSTGVGREIQLRRARIKTTYEAKMTQAVIQIDVIPFKTLRVMTDTVSGGKKNARPVLSSGGVTIKDAYLRFSEPWLKSFAVKAGIYNRPFGFEIGHSSTTRESPERSRIFQTLFPGERDLGLSLEYIPDDNITSWAKYLNLNAGLFTGNGNSVENDNNLDLIGRLGFSIPLTNVNVSIDGGVSGYAGNITTLNDTVMEFNSGLKTFVKSASYKKYDNVERQYGGADMQLYIGNVPIIGGLCLRGEYIRGVQPGSATSSRSPSSELASSSPLYKRKMSGFYAMAIQNIDPLKSQLVVKYDSYDPNIKISGADVTNTADMAFNTIGTGLIYHVDENIKIMSYFDLVKNEIIKTEPYTSDVFDNVFTLRIQYKF